MLTREEMDTASSEVIAVTGHWTKYGSLYHIPYGSLLTRGTANLLAAGRCISVDHRVNHATKEIDRNFRELTDNADDTLHPAYEAIMRFLEEHTA